MLSRIEYIIKRFQNAAEESLELSNITSEEDLGDLLKHDALKNLKQLTLSESFLGEESQLSSFLEAFSSHPNLNSLTLSECTFTTKTVQLIADNISLLKNLQNLTFSSYMDANDINILLKDFNSKFTNLKTLGLHLIIFNTELKQTLKEISETSKIDHIKTDECSENTDYQSIIEARKKAKPTSNSESTNKESNFNHTTKTLSPASQKKLSFNKVINTLSFSNGTQQPISHEIK